MAAKPDLDDGWLKYAHELDAALSVADFTKGARIVLRDVFAQIYGMAKLKTATISPSVLGDKVGMAREQVSRAVKELVDAGVLVKHEGGTFQFVKDYESWTRKGEPRLTAKEVQFCRSARDESLFYAFAGRTKVAPVNRDSLVTGSVTELSQKRDDLVTPAVTESSRDRDSLVTGSVTELSRSGVSPYRNAHAEFEKGELRNNTERADVLKFGSLPPQEEACPEYPEGDGGMWDISAGSYPMQEDQARRLFKAVWDCWKNQRLCFEFYSRQQSFTYDVWRAAFRKAKEQGKTIGSLSYIETIAVDYQANGIPSPKPALAAVAGRNPEPPPPGGSYWRSPKTLARLAAIEAAKAAREREAAAS